APRRRQRRRRSAPGKESPRPREEHTARFEGGFLLREAGDRRGRWKGPAVTQSMRLRLRRCSSAGPRRGPWAHSPAWRGTNSPARSRVGAARLGFGGAALLLGARLRLGAAGIVRRDRQLLGRPGGRFSRFRGSLEGGGNVAEKVHLHPSAP